VSFGASYSHWVVADEASADKNDEVVDDKDETDSAWDHSPVLD